MLYFENEEKRKEYCTREIDRLRQEATYTATIVKVLSDFDGKVLNVRLAKALSQALGFNVWLDHRYSWFHMEHFSGNTTTTIFSGKDEDLIDGKRIDAAKLIQDTREKREKWLREAQEIENNLSTIDSTLEQIQELKKALQALTRPINSRVREAYNIERF